MVRFLAGSDAQRTRSRPTQPLDWSLRIVWMSRVRTTAAGAVGGHQGPRALASRADAIQSAVPNRARWAPWLSRPRWAWSSCRATVRPDARARHPGVGSDQSRLGAGSGPCAPGGHTQGSDQVHRRSAAAADAADPSPRWRSELASRGEARGVLRADPLPLKQDTGGWRHARSRGSGATQIRLQTAQLGRSITN